MHFHNGEGPGAILRGVETKKSARDASFLSCKSRYFGQRLPQAVFPVIPTPVLALNFNLLALRSADDRKRFIDGAKRFRLQLFADKHLYFITAICFWLQAVLFWEFTLGFMPAPL